MILQFGTRGVKGSGGRLLGNDNDNGNDNGDKEED